MNRWWHHSFIPSYSTIHRRRQKRGHSGTYIKPFEEHGRTPAISYAIRLVFRAIVTRAIVRNENKTTLLIIFSCGTFPSVYLHFPSCFETRRLWMCLGWPFIFFRGRERLRTGPQDRPKPLRLNHSLPATPRFCYEMVITDTMVDVEVGKNGSLNIYRGCRFSTRCDADDFITHHVKKSTSQRGTVHPDGVPRW